MSSGSWAAVCALTPLAWGKYDSNAYQSAGGIERYRRLTAPRPVRRPRSASGPAWVEVTFHLPKDAGLLERVIEAIFQVHSYQEPTITVEDVLVSRSKGLDDSDNPHRWWNTTGDWKCAQGTGA